VRFSAFGSWNLFKQNTGCPRRVKIMSKTKSKKKKKTGSGKVKPSDVNEVPVDGEAEDEMSAGEKFLMASKPYWAHIALGVLSVIFASVLWTTYQNMSKESDAIPWQELNNARTQSELSSDVSSLKEMASNHEGTAASHWALLMAGDNEVNRGIDMLARDRVGGLKLIGKGVESIQQVVDAPATAKTPMIQRRSLFRLANANEALGEFEKAKVSYQAVLDLDENPKAPFARDSQRGLARCSNPDLIAFYDQFRSWEAPADTEVAPGPLVPKIPNLNVDEIKIPEGESDTFSGGDFDGGEMKKEEAAEKEVGSQMKTDGESGESSSVEMPKEVEKADPSADPVAEPAAEVETPVETPAAEVEMPKETPAVEGDAPVVEDVVPAVEGGTPETSVVGEPVAEPATGGDG